MFYGRYKKNLVTTLQTVTNDSHDNVLFHKEISTD